VIIPVRNGREYIGEAIQSVLIQGFGDFEIIIIDDGSTDYDYQLLRQQDERIRVLRLEGLGVSHARNTGMRAACGEFFAFLDADDVWFPGKLEAQIRYFDTNPEVGVVFGQFIKWTPDDNGHFPPAASLSQDCAKLVMPESERSGWLYSRLLMGLLVGMNTAVVRRKIYEQIGEFNESMRIGEDYDFWLRASRMGEMHSLNGVVALYRIHPASAMHKVAKENHMACLLRCAVGRWGLVNPDNTSLDPHELRVRLAKIHFGHGYLHYWRGDIHVARRSFAQAFVGGGHRLRSGVYFTLALLRTLFGPKSQRPDKTA
jgi:glycosyltransferase involved in cell wall biosynthesis